MSKRRIIVAVTGASGVQMSYYLLQALKEQEGMEIHLILTEGAKTTWGLESDIPLEGLTELADVIHEEKNMAASISSGSYVTEGMIIMPCSMKTLAGIAAGYADNLVVRAADVCMKEGRKVVLVPRETPMNRIHLRNLKEVAELGCAIVPPMLTFYNGPKTVEEQIFHIVGKVMLQFGLPYEKFKPWTGTSLEQIFTIKRNVFGYEISARVTIWKQDMEILLTGGSLPHIGAVAVYRGGHREGVIQPEGHKELVIAEKWSSVLSERFGGRVTTVCGIHYDHLKPDDIEKVIQVADDMLAETLDQCVNTGKKAR
jgi:4-hydroxy-3-polyprenylbenzoate decarboxylase